MSTVDIQVSGDSPAPLPAAATDAIAGAQAYLAMCQTVNTQAQETGLSVQALAAQCVAAMNAAVVASQNAYKRTVVSDVGYAAVNTDIVVEYDSLTAARTLTLPLASSCVAGRPLSLVDASGSCSAMLPITIALSGSDTFVGFTGTMRLTRTGRAIQFYPTDANSWAALFVPIISQVFTGTTGTILGGTEYAGVTALTSSGCVLTLPAASTYPRGGQLTIVDETGSCSSTSVITLNRAGSDTIAGLTSEQMQSAYQRVTLMSNGVNLWTIA